MHTSRMLLLIQNESSLHCLKIGNLQLKSDVILSPLERISDVGFRRLCFQNGAALTWTEMVYCSELVRPVGTSNEDTFTTNNTLREARRNPRGGRGANLIDTFDYEDAADVTSSSSSSSVLTGVQLLVDRTTAKDGWGTTLLQRALEQLEEGAATDRPEWKNLVAVDLNFGCPAASVSRRGAGPAQLRRRSKIRDLFQVLTEWKRTTSLPKIGAVGAKIRLGNTLREFQYKVYLPVAEAAAETGLDYLTVHARHGEQRSRDPPTWDAIREIKQTIASSSSSSNCKVIGNGDIRTADDVEKVKRLTGCDGVMIGRAAMRNPWCFRALNNNAGGQSLQSSTTRSSSSEWPTLEQMEHAAKMNEKWSTNRPASARYRRFRKENFERLRLEATKAETSGAIEGVVVVPNRDNGTSSTSSSSASQHSDWYLEWSQVATRRRHLDKIDDTAKLDGDGTTSRRRTCNSRDWKKRKRKGSRKVAKINFGTS